MVSSKGRTLKVFLVDGSPTGLLTAEIMNWTGHVITGPRSRLSELIQRPEGRRTGVYFLVGVDAGAGIRSEVYIGETDDAAQRLTTHNKAEEKGGKDFWEKVCLVTSKDANLTKGHIKYLESRLIRIARQAGRCELLNATNPGYENLPEADISDMEFFLEQIRTLLPVLGMDFLREIPTAAPPFADSSVEPFKAGSPPVRVQESSPVFNGDISKHGIVARAQEINGEFVVFKGSRARAEWEGSGNYIGLFTELVRNGVLVPTADGRHREFTRDYAFSSPSAAAAVVAGRNANGRLHWVDDKSGLSYGAWQQASVERALAHGRSSEETLDDLDDTNAVLN